MKAKLSIIIISCFAFCCVVAGGIWAAVSSVANVTLTIPAVTQQTFWGDLTISIDGYHMESEEDKIEPVVQKIYYNEESSSVVFNPLNGVEIGIDENGGPKPIEVTIILDLAGYIGEVHESGIVISLNCKTTGAGADCFSVTGEGDDVLNIESREAFENGDSPTSLSITFTIIQTGIYEIPGDNFIASVDLNMELTFAISS